MTVTDSDTRRTYWMQATTGRLHRRRNCGVSRRTRYFHTPIELTAQEARVYTKCARCFPS